MKKRYLLLLPLLLAPILVSADDGSNGKSGFVGEYPAITQTTNIIENKEIAPEANQTFVDENKIENLVKGENYRLISQVYNKTDGRFENQFMKNTEFEATEENMTLNIRLQGSAENLEGDTLVVHQTIVDEGPQEVKKGQVVSVSNDNSDEKEMVYVKALPPGRGGVTPIASQPAPTEVNATDTSGRQMFGLYLSIFATLLSLGLGAYIYKLNKKGNKK